jgi:hypothetical protein
LSESLRLENASDAKGWKYVEPADCRELERGIRQAGSIFFLVAPEIVSTAFGFDQKKAVRDAVKQKCLASSKLTLWLPFVGDYRTFLESQAWQFDALLTICA